MITVGIITSNREPFGEGIPFQLLSKGNVVATASTDAAGVVSFDVDSSGLGDVTIRLAAELAELR